MLPSASALLVFCSSLLIWTVLVAANRTQHTDVGEALLQASNVHILVKRQITESINGFNSAQKKVILDKHNLLRRGLESSDMMLMAWDSKIEKFAQNYACQCVFSNSKNRENAFGYTTLGENLYIDTAKIDPADCVQKWYDEITDFNYDTLACTPSKPCGHFTQIVWASSKALGCGVCYCEDLQESPVSKGYNIVCNYGPGGNDLGVKPYMKGKACSECPKGATHCTDGLCLRKKMHWSSIAPSYHQLPWTSGETTGDNSGCMYCDLTSLETMSDLTLEGCYCPPFSYITLGEYCLTS